MNLKKAHLSSNQNFPSIDIPFFFFLFKIGKEKKEKESKNKNKMFILLHDL